MRICEKCHEHMACGEKHSGAVIHVGPPCGVCNRFPTHMECFSPAAREIESFNLAAGVFLLRMRARFIENMHKGGWQEIPYGFAFRKLCEEVGELSEPVGAFPHGYLELPQIQDEAADVGNYALFIYNRAAQEEATNLAIQKRTDELIAKVELAQ